MSARWQKRILIALFLVFAFLLFAYQESLIERAAVNEAAPDFHLEAEDGTTWRLSDHKGSVVFLNFWTTWCDVCRAEAAALATFHERYKSQVLQVGINWREPWPIIRPFLEQYQMDYVTLRDADGTVAKRYRLRGVPENWMIDETGIARLFWTGQSSFETLQQAYEQVTGRPIDENRAAPFSENEKALHLVAVKNDSGQSSVGIHDTMPMLWLATTKGLYSTMNGGQTWQAHPFWQGHTMNGLAALPARILVASSNEAGLQWSRDGGVSWSELELPMGVKQVLGIAVSAPAEPRSETSFDETAVKSSVRLYLATDGPRFFQKDVLHESSSWVEIDTAARNGSTQTLSEVHDIASDGSQWFVAAGKDGLWSIDDSGIHPISLTTNQFMLSQRSSAGITPTRSLPLPVYGLALIGRATSNGQEGGLWIAAENGLWRITDIHDTLPSGPVNEIPARRFADVAPDPFLHRRIWAVAPNGDLYLSDDHGVNWRWLPY